MNVIIVESKAYAVNKIELKKIDKMQKKLLNESNFKVKCNLEMELSSYLTEKITKSIYRDLGFILFDFRL